LARLVPTGIGTGHLSMNRKKIIFGVWDDLAIGDNWLIFNNDWERDKNGKKVKALSNLEII